MLQFLNSDIILFTHLLHQSWINLEIPSLQLSHEYFVDCQEWHSGDIYGGMSKMLLWNYFIHQQINLAIWGSLYRNSDIWGLGNCQVKSLLSYCLVCFCTWKSHSIYMKKIVYALSYENQSNQHGVDCLQHTWYFSCLRIKMGNTNMTDRIHYVISRWWNECADVLYDHCFC